MAGVEIDNVTKVFAGDTVAVRDLTLAIGHGELLVLLGPSGCGKSTVLRLLAGLERPTSGRISIDGVDVSDQTPQQRNVAMVFQNFALYPHKTVRGNLEFPLRMRGMAKRETAVRVERAASLLGLGELLDRRPRELSGGQAQRVAMGRAIVRDPQLFLMDEPLSNLDAGLRLEIRGEIAALQERLGTTTVYVTHDQVEAMTLGRRVAVLRGGCLQQVAPPQELYERPENLFVATFVGSPSMNLCPTSIEGSQPITVRFADHNLGLPEQSRLSRLTTQQRQRISVAGLRPEALSWPDADPARAKIEVDVEAVEMLGHEQIVYFHAAEVVDADGNVAEGLMAARLSLARSVEPGARIELAIDGKALQAFDQEGRRVDPSE